MKKNIVACTIIAITFICSAITVSAYDYTGSLLSPKFKLNIWCRARAYSLTSSVKGVRAEDAKFSVYYQNGIIGTLEKQYVSNSNRKFDIQLKDEDPVGNENDILKKYQAKFTGRNITNLVRTTTYDKYIDSSTDYTAELYVTGKLGNCSGDSYLPGGTNLFNYQLAIS